MKLAQALRDYQQLEQRIISLGRLRDKIANMHCCKLMIDDMQVNSSEHGLTKEAIDAMVESVSIPLRQAQEELQELEKRFEGL